MEEVEDVSHREPQITNDIFTVTTTVGTDNTIRELELIGKEVPKHNEKGVEFLRNKGNPKAMVIVANAKYEGPLLGTLITEDDDGNVEFHLFEMNLNYEEGWYLYPLKHDYEEV